MGGNIFKETSRIHKNHIAVTLNNYRFELRRLFPKSDEIFMMLEPVGSAYKKEYSGDLDLAISSRLFDITNFSMWGINPEEYEEIFQKLKKRARTATEDQLKLKAFLKCIGSIINENSDLIKVDEKKIGIGSFFTQFPQYDSIGEETGEFVQIDFMIGDIDWLRFSYHSAVYKDNVKGLHRTQLMLACFSVAGYTFNHVYGVKNKETQEIVANSPQEACDLLNSHYGFSFTIDDLMNYFTICDSMSKNLNPSQAMEIFDTFLKILDKTRCDIPLNLQTYWEENQDRLGLTGKFLPEDSNLKQLTNGIH